MNPSIDTHPFCLLYILFSNVTSLKLILITMYCSQGDNIPDAVAMATHVDQWMNMVCMTF